MYTVLTGQEVLTPCDCLLFRFPTLYVWSEPFTSPPSPLDSCLIPFWPVMLRPASSFPLSILVFIATFLLVRPAAAFTYSPVAEPIAVKSPFLSTYNAGGSSPAGNWASNSGDGHITAWSGLARVDGVGYVFMGNG